MTGIVENGEVVIPNDDGGQVVEEKLMRMMEKRHLKQQMIVLR